jgi:hypothetical protein
VVCDGKDVETAGAVEIDHVLEAQDAVAPRRVSVELAEQKVFGHERSVASPDRTRGGRTVTIRRRSGERPRGRIW